MAVIEAHLRTLVSLHDDQSLPGMYDLTIRYPDGRVGAVEVTAAEDQDWAARQAAVSACPVLRDARLKGGWMVVLRQGAMVNTARARLPDLLWRLEQAGIDEASVFSAGGFNEDGRYRWIPGQLAEAQTETAKATDIFAAGTISITSPMQVAWLSQDPDDVVTFVEEFVESRPTDVKKLGRAKADERHLFIWSGELSTGWVSLRALALDVPRLPTRKPRLPDEISHVWVAPEATPASRIVVWSASSGWVTAGTTSSTGRGVESGVAGYSVEPPSPTGLGKPPNGPSAFRGSLSG